VFTPLEIAQQGKLTNFLPNLSPRGVLPSLWFFEVGNIVGLKQPSSASLLMETLTSFHFDEESAHAIYERAFELMKRFKVTFYDASYHAVP